MAELTKIELPTPIIIGEKQYETLAVRKPKAGDLRGLQTADILHMNINSFAELIPRISVTPSMNKNLFYDLESENLTVIQAKVVDFFVTADG